MPRLSKAKSRSSTPSGVEICVPSPSVKKRKMASGLQTKSPKKPRQTKKGHQDILTQKVATEEPNEVLLDLGEKVATGRNSRRNPQAMATRSAVARKSQALSSPTVTTTMEGQSSSGPVPKTMSTYLTGGRKSQSSPCLMTRAMATRLSIARKSQPLSRPVTTTMDECSSVDRKGQSSSGPVPKTRSTYLTGGRKGQSSPCLTTRAMATRLSVARKSQSSTGPVTNWSQLAVTNKGQSSSCPMTTDLAPPLTIATTGQSPSGDTSNIKQTVTETTNKETSAPEKPDENRPRCTGKRRPSERRFSVRLVESSSRFRDIVVRKQDGFTHILLSTKSSENNSLNLEVMKQLQDALNKAAVDDSKLVLLSAIGNVFCFGLDFTYFIQRLTANKKRERAKMAESIKNFVNTFIQFKKPIIAAVNGPALGLGASILPLCDVVWANEKAWFQTPYTTFGQSPDGCSSFTFPNTMGEASANAMLLSGQKLTAQEACKKGLVSQVFWPQTFSQEVMIRIKELASCNAVVLEESKALLRFTTKMKLEEAIERECKVLENIWGSAEGIEAMLKYLQKKIEY
ncbi:chromodomain Y-like protein [Alexandromys fortis]|uniref:chromodomain Y-like protein n=1 Tax=Alexandromys fortis TaxID=100897 RepID=UPI002152F008|nr:chromodomain Y-like protein [Microtus fortis]